VSSPSDIPGDGWISSELVREDPDFADLVEEFVGSLDQRLTDLRSAMDLQDLNQFRTLAHQLKGTGGGHGYPILTEKAALLEQQAIAGDVASLKQGIDELAGLIARVIVAPPGEK
jgi:histidine phosphotransfer protein HptB